ncbi:SGNH/GDSL hydrolase family protein [Psychroserpens sp. AS72]|uniref:SGNH/GDSL hydrolase family protein n=1 Tax=Psychroserpens sp. AS72 TaxID=3135775 RepID=UPI003174E361
MFKLYPFLFLLIWITSCENEEKTNLPLHNKRVLILGNSITQHGHYVDIMEYYLRKAHPNSKLDIISIGLSAETISGTTELGREFPRPYLHNRLDTALNEIKPDLVLACYGMNDGNYQPLDSLRFSAYKKGILKLKSKVEQRNAQLILLTPTVFDPDPIKNRISNDGEKHTYWHPYYDYNKVLTTYSDWLLSLATESQKVINLNHNLNNVLMDMKGIKEDSTFVPDGVHPNKIGHFYIAQNVLRDLYPNLKLENPNIEMERLNNDSLFILIHKRRELRSEGWRNYIGFTKEKTVKSDDITSTIEKVKELDVLIESLQSE